MRGRVLGQLRESLRDGGLAALRAAASAGADPVAVAIVAWEHFCGGHPALTAARRLHLWRSARRADRFACFGRGESGAGAVLLVDRMQAHAEMLAAGDAEPVWSLDYFVCELRATSRRWRRNARGVGPVRDTGQRERAMHKEMRRRG